MQAKRFEKEVPADANERGEPGPDRGLEWTPSHSGGIAMKRIMGFARKAAEERGITGLETAIVLIAFVVVAAVFAFVVLSTGLFSSERGKETVYAGLAKTRGSMELTGGVIATSNGTKITNVAFDVTLAAGGDSVNLNYADTTNRSVISYQDTANSVANVTYTTTVITGNSDKLLEQGELFEIGIDLTQAALTAVTLGTNTTFTFEVKPPTGSYMVIQRTTPASITNTVINLN
jgi:flagellin FlaB